MSTQDFSQRISIAVRKDIEPWQVTNTIGHIAAALGNKLGNGFLTGEQFTTREGIALPRNSQYPIIVLGAEGKLHDFVNAIITSGLLHIVYVRDMLDEIDDRKLETTITQKSLADLDILGVGIFGPNEKVKELTKGFKLWK